MIDLLDPALHASGEIMRVVRELPPVTWTDGRRGPGYWSIVGHPELIEAARNVDAFSSWWGTRPEVIRPESARRPLHNLDGQAHQDLRAIAARIADAERLAALDPVIEALVEREFAPSEPTDLVAIAERIVAQTFAAWLGFRAPPDELLARVVDVHTAGASLIDAPPGERPSHAVAAKHASEAIAALVTTELAHAAEGTLLHVLRGATDQAAGLATLFLEAGMPTSIDAIASAVVDLARHAPAIEDTSVLVEELLRRASPIAQFARRATRAVELGGQRIAEGQQIVLWFAAANHDPRVFPDPDALMPRTPNPHVAFGIGPHRCVGVAIGRRLVRAVVSELRTRRIELIGEPLRRASSYLRGFSSAPIRLRPGRPGVGSPHA